MNPRTSNTEIIKLGRLGATLPALLILVTMAFSFGCASDPEPRVEDFPFLIQGTWEQIGGPVGTLKFEGSDASGVGVRSADGIAAESFTYQWVAPAQIRTDLGDDLEFNVLFENDGETLVLTSVAKAETDQIIRYNRIK